MSGSPSENRFHCSVCGAEFNVPQAALDKYPGWTPSRCLRCRDAVSGKPSGRGGGQRKAGRSAAQTPSSERGLPAQLPPSGRAPGMQETHDGDLDARLRRVIDQCSSGPEDGVFTDGGSSGNPGPGGWGAVRVKQNQVVAQKFGREEMTTNNRMELSALIAGYQMIGPEEEETIWSDSQLCVNTINLWAEKWERNGWRRKDGPIANLELVKELYALARSHPRARLCWLKAHVGSRWNEYVDTLATGHLR